ncbi:uncharacterized protein RCC_10063 [Ramularia collo-cygni]|uniref:Uncharacterized protein n=1 Tax=Ramularia collo-cygni TaxID=112498 RepID=A0A2D3VBI5_9PEZI|nr:uncharacterized protein RCC_10063 [Ramularia collo-cygni]CZT24340.1 uncharacterized protein RCC_10063 [Ramularia collo-cygni]
MQTGVHDGQEQAHRDMETPLKPKVMIITMFHREASLWLSKSSNIKFERKVSIPGLSLKYKEIYCTASGDVCLVITGMALVNGCTFNVCAGKLCRIRLVQDTFLDRGHRRSESTKGNYWQYCFIKVCLPDGSTDAI